MNPRVFRLARTLRRMLDREDYNDVYVVQALLMNLDDLLDLESALRKEDADDGTDDE